MAELGTTYTDPRGAIMGNIQQLTGEVTSQIKGAPAQKEQMTSDLLQNEGILQPLAQDRGALVQKLLQADIDIAKKHGDPNSPDYIENPAVRQQALEQYQSGLYGGLAEVESLMGARKNVLKDTVDRGMAVLDAGMKAKQLEMDTQFKLLEAMDRKEALGMKSTATGQIKPATYSGLQAMETAMQQIQDATQDLSMGKDKGMIVKKLLSGPQFVSSQIFGQDTVSRLENLESIRQLMATQVARAALGAAYNPRTTNLNMYLSMVPDITDHPEERAFKLANLRQLIDSQWMGALGPNYQGEAIAGMPEHLVAKYASVPTSGQGTYELGPEEETPVYDETDLETASADNPYSIVGEE